MKIKTKRPTVGSNLQLNNHYVVLNAEACELMVYPETEPSHNNEPPLLEGGEHYKFAPGSK